MPRPFLTARWANLAIVSYAVPPAVLAPFMPAAPQGDTLELDTRDDLVPGAKGKPSAFVSLVGFQFQQCRVFGVPWPGHTEFAEINLRFYVRTVGSRQRGVVFIREVVPRPLIAWAARRFYNEPYVATECWGRITQDARRIQAEYGLVWPPPMPRRGAAGPAPQRTEHTFRIVGSKPVSRPGPTTVEHWFKEHQWGFGMRPSRQAGQPPRGHAFEVIHPTWGVYPVQECRVKVDFGAVYGPDWGFLSGAEPVWTVFAAGSEIAVFPARTATPVRWSVKR